MSPAHEPFPADAGSRLGLRPGLRKALANVVWLVLDRVLGLAMGVTIAVLLARHLGTARFGLLSYALSFVALFGFLASLGLQGIVVREIVRAPAARPPRWNDAGRARRLCRVHRAHGREPPDPDRLGRGVGGGAERGRLGPGDAEQNRATRRR